MDESSCKTLFVDKIPVSCTQLMLSNLFSECGKVVRATIIKNNNPVSTFGFVEYRTSMEANAALQQFNNFDMGHGLRLVIEMSSRRKKKQDSNRALTSSNNRPQEKPSKQLNTSANNNSNTSFGAPRLSSQQLCSTPGDSSTRHNYCQYCGGISSKECVVCGTSYCSQDCQVKDWSNHQLYCKPKQVQKYKMSHIESSNIADSAVPHSSTTPPQSQVRPRMLYRDFSAAFSVIPPTLDTPIFSINSKMPLYFYGLVSLVLTACRLSVFPLNESSKRAITEFLKFEEKMLTSVKMVTTSLPDKARLFGYKTSNDSFHRVEVDSCTTRVFAFDSGEPLGALDKSRLFVLPDELVSVKPLRAKVSLLDINHCAHNKLNGQEYLNEALFGKIVKVVEPSVCEQRGVFFIKATVLSMDELVNYNKLVLKSGFAEPRQSIISKLPSLVGPLSISPKVLSSHLPPLYHSFSIYPTAVVSPDLIWAQVFHENSDSLKRLIEDMSTEYKGADSYVPSVGEICAVRFASDRLCYRAEIIHFNNNGSMDVLFVDYGNKGTVLCDSVYQLNPRFLTFPKQALHFSLCGVAPTKSKWSNEACMYLRSTVLERKTTVNIVNEENGKYKINMNHPDISGTTINEILVNRGLAEKLTQMKGVAKKKTVSPKIGRGSAFNCTDAPKSPSGAATSPNSQSMENRNASNAAVTSPNREHARDVPTSSVPSSAGILPLKTMCSRRQLTPEQVKNCKPDPELIPLIEVVNPSPTHSVSKGREPLQPFCPPKIILPISSMTQGVVVNVKNPQLFHVMKTSTNRDYTQLWESIQTASLRPVGDQIDIGDICLAKRTQDNSYSRVEVLKLKPNKALVYFMDYGSKQPVFVKDLRAIEERFCIMPQQAIPCSLDIAQREWSKDDTSYFTKLVLNKHVDLKVVGIVEGVHVVEMLLDSSLDVAKCMQCTKPRGPPTSTMDSHSDKTTPVVGKSYNDLEKQPLTDHSIVVIATVLGFDEFYVQLYNEENRQHVSKVIMPDGFHGDPVTTPLDKNSMCCAKYAEDNQWYRARVVAPPTGSGLHHVQFIDFGNYASVPLSDIAQYPDSLCSIPVLATKCSLFGVQQKDAATLELFMSLTNNKLLTVSVVEPPNTITGSWVVSLMIRDGSGSCEVDIGSYLNDSQSLLLMASYMSNPYMHVV